MAPNVTTGGIPFSPAPVMIMYDAAGNLVSAADHNVTITALGGVSVSGGVAATGAIGEVSFPLLAINPSGTYTLRAATPSCDPSCGGTGAVVTVGVGPAVVIEWSAGSNPIAATGGMTISPPLSLDALDAGGNKVGAGSTTIELRAVGPGTLSGVTSAFPLTQGASFVFDSLVLDTAGNYSIEASVLV